MARGAEFFHGEDNMVPLKAFAEKAATDPAYRASCLDGSALWCRVYKEYETATRELYQTFAPRGYPSNHREAKRLAHLDAEDLERRLRRALEGIKRELYPGSTKAGDPTRNREGRRR